MLLKKIRKYNGIVFWAFLKIKTICTGALMGIKGFSDFPLNFIKHIYVMQAPSEFGLKYSRVSFPSLDGLNLRGWWFEASSEKPTIILLHGVGANRAEPAERVFGIAEELIEYGYNILAFDWRAHGESEGKHSSVGYLERRGPTGRS